MKKTLLALFILLLMALPTVTDASWLIDFEKFSASVHREISCQDCHENIAAEKLHPDPLKVNRQLSDFFTADNCMNCHDTVQETLDKGRHGSQKADDPKKYENCIQCHNPHYQLPIGQESAETVAADKDSLSKADRLCMDCHGLSETDEPHKIAAFCFHCHAQTGTRTQAVAAQIIPLIDPGSYQSVPHAEVACLACHPRAAAFNHADQVQGDCLQCHVRHNEKTAHDAHSLVSCQACHLNNVEASRDPQSKKVLWHKQRLLGTPLTIHAMERNDNKASCRRCHISKNEIGAAAMVLPAKSLLCMPCHAATFSAADAVSIVALLIFAAGLALMFSVVLTGSIPDRTQAGVIQKIFHLIMAAVKAVFSPKISVILKALFLDVLLQRRLYHKSAWRWLIHSFIFLSFGFRFCWGLTALLASSWKPEWSSLWFMLDKNHPYTAFLFDLSGILILLGVAMAFIRGLQRKTSLPPNLPGQDRLALSLIGGIVIVGFILEALRIAMTGWPDGSGYAFAGYGISLLFSGAAGITDFYGYIWYLHAIVTGVFVAYLPFSRLIHMVIAPITLAMRTLSESGHTQKT
ncbi:MAG: respiratory nitrate reductase subunit gamma [Desulfobacterales bacterium]|nr:respiratory nitrate reductase subunit gamma [Desulfobacterales bacterium]